jgi:hypothetical protein
MNMEAEYLNLKLNYFLPFKTGKLARGQCYFLAFAETNPTS